MPVFCGQGITDALLVPTSVSTILFLPVYNVSGNAEWFFIYGKEKIKYVPPVFEVAEVEKDYLICRLDFIESILRRGAKGIKLAELKVE